MAKRAASYQRIYVDAADAKNTASVPSLIASKEVRREAFKILIGRFENLFGSDVRLSRLRRFARVVQRESAAKHLIAREQSPAALVTSPLLVPLPIERPRTYVVGR